ncbi:ferredoxin [Sciscionella marina]|uniref:ferredoxin n=1 Tax=Sciscionella marina TaxID=508770 RepID=UPI000378A6CF
MRIIVDKSRCDMHGDCVVEVPELFDLEDDADEVTVLDEEPPEELRGKAERAVTVCPVAAIKIEG